MAGGMTTVRAADRASGILEFARADPELVREYFVRRGYSTDLIEWKYFDARFNRSRERGYVWINEGRVKGFIGLIPFKLTEVSGTRKVVWTCDWHVEEAQLKPGVGVLLLRKAMASNPYLATLGGNEITRAIVPRLASKTVPDAAVAFHLPLRLAAALDRLQRLYPEFGRMAAFRRMTRSPLTKMPLRPWLSRRSRDPLKWVDGVSPSSAHLFSMGTADGAPEPVYDREHLEWQLVRCPKVRSISCFLGAPEQPDAAGLLWSSVERPLYWRAAFKAFPDKADALELLVAAASREVHRRKGAALSVLCSLGDIPLQRALKRRGFVQERSKVPLSLLSWPDSDIEPYAGLSYLDADLGYLF